MYESNDLMIKTLWNYIAHSLPANNLRNSSVKFMRLFLSKNSRELMNAGLVSTAHRVPNLANTRFTLFCCFFSYGGGRGGDYYS